VLKSVSLFMGANTDVQVIAGWLRRDLDEDVHGEPPGREGLLISATASRCGLGFHPELAMSNAPAEYGFWLAPLSELLIRASLSRKRSREGGR
jgi:hypothetical protein